jgi:hypothetical protein
MKITADRRSFLSYFGSLGLTSTLFPGVLWALLQEKTEAKITREMISHAATAAGISFTEHESDAMIAGMNQNLLQFEKLHGITLGNGVAPPLYFNPIVPGMKIDRATRPFRPSKSPLTVRPSDLERLLSGH